jgi:hypothetical protein
MRYPPLLDELDAALADVVPREPVALEGAWRASVRRTYRDEAQLGTGSGPWVEVVDQRWTGALTSAAPVAGILFLVTPGEICWVKSAPAAPTQPVSVSLHAHADCSPASATLGVGMGRAGVHSVVVRVAGDLLEACTLGPRRLTTGRVVRLVEAEDALFLVVLLQGSLLKVGRNRLWRLRDDLAVNLPPRVRLMMTRRRTGGVRLDAPA